MPSPASSAFALTPGEGAAASQPKPHLASGFALGKYRDIVIAVAFFLLFDLGVLLLNFVVSFQIAEDAISINLSGRERMLTQRLSKVLFAWELAAAGNDVPPDVVNELQVAAQLFDSTLQAFVHGGTVTGGDGKPVHLPAAGGPRSAEILRRAETVWGPWRQLLEPLRAIGARAPIVDVAAAARYARAHNLELLGLMNELTTDLESEAGGRASLLRQVQTAGIALALLNFVFILFKFVRRLRLSDASVEEANEENREILSVVREGLFLLTPEFRLGTQVSSSVGAMFGRVVRPGDELLSLLQPLVSAKTLDDARSYVELLFTPHIKEELVQSINPLSEVELAIVDGLGKPRRRHLSLQFNRVMDAGQVRHLLVTVQDVTTRVELEQRLQGEQQRAQREFDLLMRASETDPATLRRFVEHAETSLLKVNELLRHMDASSHHDLARRSVDAIHRHVHSVKGEASMLGLDLLSATAHEFESQLQTLREASTFSGDALLALPLPLEELLTRVQTLKRWGQRERPAPSQAGPALGDSLSDLVRRIAADCGRPARFTHRLDDLATLPAATRDALEQITVQLVRNAAVHGIDPLPQRLMLGKPSVGGIEAALESGAGETCELVVRDDGGGLDADRVRLRLLELRWFDEEQLADMTPGQIVSQIFRPGFSTAAHAGEHGGRGVGLDLVAALVRELGARLLVSSRRGQGTELRVRLHA